MHVFRNFSIQAHLPPCGPEVFIPVLISFLNTREIKSTPEGCYYGNLMKLRFIFCV